MDKIGIAIFGAGRMGTIHAANLVSSNRADVLWIVDAVPENGKRLLDRLHLDGKAEVVKFGEHDHVLKDDRVQAVVVTVPTRMHINIVKECLAAGKAVFCEKPLTLSSESSRECFQQAKTSNKPLLCGFNRRFDPTIQSIYNQVQEGVIGQIQSIKTCSRDPDYPTKEYVKNSGGIFRDALCHDFDIICYFVGEFPVSVYAIGHAFDADIASAGDYDQVIVTMQFPSGVTASIDMNRKAVYGYDQRFEIFGSKGMLQEGNNRHTASVLSNSNGERVDPLIIQFVDRYKDAYRMEMEHYIDVVSGRSEPLVTKEQVIAGIKIAEACQESIDSGQAVKMNYH